MRHLRCVFLAYLGLVLSAFAAFGAADNAVLYWNNEMVKTIRLARTPPPVAALHMASLHASV